MRPPDDEESTDSEDDSDASPEQCLPNSAEGTTDDRRTRTASEKRTTHRQQRDPRAESPAIPQPRAQRHAPGRRRQTRSGISKTRASRSTDTSSPPSQSGPPSKKDPVQESFDGELDLYEIARWEVRTPLDSFAVRLTNALEESKRWLLLSLAIALFVAQFVVATTLVVELPLLGVLAVLSTVPALALAGYFWYGDPTTREPLLSLAITFLLAVAFASLAGVVNGIALPLFEMVGLFGLTVGYFLVVGPIEETVKWLAVRVYAYRTDAFQTVVDGVVYGAMAGVGFAAIENVLYILLFSLEPTTVGLVVQNSDAVSIATQRAFVGPGHVIFSAWAGFYLGLAKFNQSKRGPIVVKGLLIAAFIHALYNTLVTTLPLSRYSFVGFLLAFHGFWFVLLYRKIRAYRRLYRAR